MKNIKAIYLRFMKVPRMLQKHANKINHQLIDILERHQVKTQIKQNIINFNTAKISVVVKTKTNKYIGTLYTLYFDGNKTKIKFNTHACTSAYLNNFETVVGLIINEELRYFADYTIKELLHKIKGY